MKTPFYHNITRKIVVAFGSLFNEIQIDRVDSTEIYDTIPVPIIYSAKEKFIQRINDPGEVEGTPAAIEETLPRMGYELTSLSYDPVRKTNTVEKLRDDDDLVYTYNRIPYKMHFSLYIASRKIDDALRIVEQILPYFTPELTITVRDNSDINFETNIPIILQNNDFAIDAEGSFDERRTIFWSLDFVADVYLYAETRSSSIIKKVIVDFTTDDGATILETYTATVDPFESTSEDEYTIIETII